MEQSNVSNVKKWGWWAVVGLVALLVIAGLIIAIATSGPKPSTEVATDETSNQDNNEETPSGTNEEDDTSKQEQTTPELPAISETPSTDLPKTGPEDTILPIVIAGIAGSVISYGVIALRRR